MSTKKNAIKVPDGLFKVIRNLKNGPANSGAVCLQISGPSDEFNVYSNDDVNLREMAESVAITVRAHKNVNDMSEGGLAVTAALYFRGLSGNVRLSSDFDYIRDEVDRVIRLQLNGNNVSVISWPVVNGVPGSQDFNGTTDQFKAWSDSNGLESILGKFIKFHYTGGSKDDFRLVNVEKVEPDGDTYLIRGKDIEKGEFRSYRLDRIEGDIFLLN